VRHSFHHAGAVSACLRGPVFGAIADATGPRKPWIFIFGIVGVIGSWSLWYAVPGMNNLTFVVAAMLLTLVGFEFAAVFNNAMMPGLVPRSGLGKLSGSAWGLGYVGGLVTLIIILGFFAGQPGSGKTLLGIMPLFGLDTALREGDRIAGPMTAVWFAVFIIPMFLFTPDAPQKTSAKGAVKQGLSQLWQTLKKLPAQKSYFSFLLSSMFYRDALNALYAFGGIYAANVLGWAITQIGIFGILANITGAIGAWFGGKMDHKFGPKPVVAVAIVLLTIACIVIVSTSPTQVLFIQVAGAGTKSALPDISFYICGGLIGAAGGALQAASRTLLTDQVPHEKVTEAFGLYALSGKATSFIGPLSIAWATGYFGSSRLGVTPVIILFMIGLILLMSVKSKRT